MPTLHQLARNRRQKRKKKVRRISLESCPQKRGTVLRSFKKTPRKPNSALRSVIRVRLSNYKLITAHVPGQGHRLNQHNNILIRGGRTKDLPGLKYKAIRGKLDLFGVLNRKTARTKYGVLETAEDKKKRKKIFSKHLVW